MLIVVTALAVGLVLYEAIPWLLQLVAIVLVWAVLPTALVILVIFARGNVQTFAMGALVPLAMWVWDSHTVPLNSTRAWVAAPLMAIFCGLLAVWLRRLIRRKGWDRPGPIDPV